MSRFRPEYRSLTGDEIRAVNEVKELAEAMAKIVDEHAKDSRCVSLTYTKLEEAVMWAVKGITA